MSGKESGFEGKPTEGYGGLISAKRVSSQRSEIQYKIM